MIEKRYGYYIIICDICEEDESERGPVETFDTFQEAVDSKKENGWKSQRHKGNWQDVCPKCQDVCPKCQEVRK